MHLPISAMLALAILLLASACDTSPRTGDARPPETVRDIGNGGGGGY